VKRSLNPDEPNALLSYEFDRGSNYESVLHLTDALGALVPESETNHPDQRFFQVTHLITEYAWVQVHYELRRAAAHLDKDRFPQAVRLFDRATGLSEVTVQAVRLLTDHLPQHSLLTMRNALPEDATGLDSPGYRNLRRVARPVWKAYEQAVERAGLSLQDVIAQQDDGYDGPHSADSQALALVREAMLRLDGSVLGWKQHHLIMVWSQLGGQPGLRRESDGQELPQSLGGRSLATLEARSQLALFPELWRAADEAYWLLGTRHDTDAPVRGGGSGCPVQH
jgi:tryptophan 2,3-dioxygenase